MNNYIFCLSPVLDSVKLHYPEKEIGEVSFKKLPGDVLSYIELDLTSKEKADSIVAAWIFDGCGQIDFANDGSLYIKVSAQEIVDIIENTLNLLQDEIKLCGISELITSKFRTNLFKLLNGETDLKIINCTESMNTLTKKQWLYSEYDRILNDKEYSDYLTKGKDLDSIIIVYKVHHVFSYEYDEHR